MHKRVFFKIRVMDQDTIRRSVRKCIAYNEKVLNTQYPSLILDNEQKIVEALWQSHREEFSQIALKQHQYNKLVLKFLQQTFKFLPQKSSHSSLPDPSQITNRYHGAQYVKQVLMNNDVKVRAIRELVLKHKHFQDDCRSQREQQINQFNGKKKELSSNKGPQVLSGVNDSIVTRLRQETEEELRSLDAKMAHKMKQLSYENMELLRGLKVPFFYTEEKFWYPELPEDQKFMLDLLRDSVL